MDIFSEACLIAIPIHDGEYRKDGKTPYILHPMAVCVLLKEWGVTDQEILAAAILHDTLESLQQRLIYNDEDISDFLSCHRQIQKIVFDLTMDDRYKNKKEYLASFINKGPVSIIIKLADRLCNVKDFMADKNFTYAKKYYNLGVEYLLFNLIDNNKSQNIVDVAKIISSYVQVATQLDQALNPEKS